MKLYPLPRQQDESAIDTAHRMRVALAGDIEEIVKTSAIKELNTELIKSEQLMGAWSFLNSDERRAWKLYCKQG